MSKMSNNWKSVEYFDAKDQVKEGSIWLPIQDIMNLELFGNLKGKVFRVGCMGEVHRYHVMRTISAISSTLAMMGYDTDPEAGLKVANQKLSAL